MVIAVVAGGTGQVAAAGGSGDLTINVTHANGDQAAEVNALIIYQDGTHYKTVTNYPSVELKYTFSNLPTGHTYTVHAYIHDQFAGSTSAITISQDDWWTWGDESSKSATIQVKNPIEFAPTIYYQDGVTPLKGATVYVKSHEDDPDGSGKVVWRSATTTADGTLNPSPLWLYPTAATDPGYYTVDVVVDGETVASRQFDALTSDSSPSISTSKSVPTYDLSVASTTGGRVEETPTGAVKTGTTVSVTAEPNPGYRFDHWSGDYPSGHQSDRSITVTMDQAKSVTAHFDKLAADLTVAVRLPNGEQANDVNGLVIWQDDFTGEPFRTIENYPTVDLAHTVNSLPGGHDYKVVAYINDQMAGSTGWITIRDSAVSRTIQVEDSVWIKPTVYYQDGTTPLPDATVKITSHEGVTWRSATTSSDGTTTPRKLWVYPTNEGHYTVEVYHDGNKVASKQLSSLESNRELSLTTSVSLPTTEVWFTVSKQGTIEGYAFAGEPIKGATVSVAGKTKQTNAEGKISFQLPIGTHTLTVTADGFETVTDTIDVPKTGSFAVSVPMTRTGAGVLKLEVVNKNGDPIAANKYRVLVNGTQVTPNAQGELVLDEGTHTVAIKPTDFGAEEGIVVKQKQVTIQGQNRTEITIMPIRSSTSTGLTHKENQTIRKFIGPNEDAIIFGPVKYKETSYLIGYAQPDKQGVIRYISNEPASARQLFTSISGWSAAFNIQRTFVFRQTPSGLEFVSAKKQAIIRNVTQTQAALAWARGDINRQPRYTELHDQMIHSPRADVNFWFQNLVGSTLHSPEDRYLASLQAITTTSRNYQLVPEIAAQEIIKAKSAAASAKTALDLAKTYKAQKYVKVAGKSVKSKYVRQTLIRYADQIKRLDTSKIGYGVGLASLVLSISEHQTYKDRRVAMLSQLQTYAHTHQGVSLPEGLDRAITELEIQHENSRAKTIEAIEQWAKQDGITIGTMAAKTVGTKFGSWLVTKSTYAASVSSWVTSSTAGTLAAGAASLASTALLGWQVGGLLTGRPATYAALIKAEYSLRIANHIDDIRQDIQNTYGDNLARNSEIPQADIATTFHAAAYMEQLALVSYYRQDANAIEKSILGEYESFLKSIFGEEAYAREKKNRFLDQAARERTFAKKFQRTAVSKVLANYASRSGIQANLEIDSEPAKEYQTKESVSVSVTVTNTGRSRHPVFVGYSVVGPDGTSYDNHNSTGKTVTLAPSETKRISLSWTVQEAAPTGKYDVVVSVWKETNRTNLHTRLDTVRKPEAFSVVTNDEERLAQLTETVVLGGTQVDPDSLADAVRIERGFAHNTSVEVRKRSITNYTVAISAPESASNVTVYLRREAISTAADLSNLTMYLDGEQHPFTVKESAGPGASPWVAFNVPHFSTRTVSFIADTTSSERFNYTAEQGVAVNGDTAYVLSDGQILKIDLETDKVLTVFPAPDGTNQGLAYGNGSLWYADAQSDAFAGQILELNPSTGEVRSRINMGVDPYGLAFGNGSLWVAEVTSVPNAIHEYTPTGDHVRQFAIRGPGESAGPAGLAYYNNSMWVGTHSALSELTLTGKRKQTIHRDTGFTGLAGSPTTLYGPTTDGTLTVLRTTTPTNNRPTAAFTRSPANSTVTVGESVTFNASTSTDTDGTITAYTWNFDNDTRSEATTAVTTHTFTSPGTYRVTLTVTDEKGATTTIHRSLTVSPSAERSLTLTTPRDHLAPTPGHTIVVNATLTNTGATRSTGEIVFTNTTLPSTWIHRVAGTDPTAQDQFAVITDGHQVVFSDIDPNETVRATMTIQIPATNATGTYTTTIQLQHNNTQITATRITITVTPKTPLIEQYDTDENGIETTELLAGIHDWRQNALSLQNLLALIHAWQQ
ncbi:PKD domain-containing protein [Salarchaeum sp. JOR-1]|uniref:PKD domain-containing protein n=1 Tax=Salarchaeum sp. JOR-1 TaxID=2599399 RepID=UPI00143D2270|nr:PKD domain-containing protein [Salarchaeum sp. JOR-1]